MSKNKHSRGNKKSFTPPAAQSADRHVLYEQAVQCVEAEIDMVDDTFKQLRGRQARFLREDFCGTANTSCEWVKRRDDNRAFSVDLDPAVLRWGLKHNVGRLESNSRERIELRQADVCSCDIRQMDIILAMNFSYQLFKTRDALRHYFQAVHESLGDDGIFFIDVYGGYESFREIEEATEYDNFTYIWDQARYNPINGDLLCYIHFSFPDGSRIRKAFRYDWRLWTLPELQELLSEAGFEHVLVHWEGTEEKTNEGNGVFTATDMGEADASWICYISAER